MPMELTMSLHFNFFFLAVVEEIKVYLLTFSNLSGITLIPFHVLDMNLKQSI